MTDREKIHQTIKRMIQGAEETLSAGDLGKIVVMLNQRGYDVERSLAISCSQCAAKCVIGECGQVASVEQAGKSFDIAMLDPNAYKLGVSVRSSYKCPECRNTRLKVTCDMVSMEDRLCEGVATLPAAPFDIRHGFHDEQRPSVLAPPSDCGFICLGTDMVALRSAARRYLRWASYNPYGYIRHVESQRYGNISITASHLISCLNPEPPAAIFLWIMKSADGTLWICDPDVSDLSSHWRLFLGDRFTIVRG
ncbi:MAG: hypothetical protein Q7N50_05010 [Armatimonadota bacterium]|nr:hypothetical protein [Armatimonadota bacterium]